MTNLKVTLVACTPDLEKTIACAAKICYAKSDVNTLFENLTEEKTRSFLDMLSEIGHESPVEHGSFTFAVEGVSRSLLAQLTRHRIASYSVRSQRYVKMDHFEYITPPEIEKIPEAKKEYISAMEEDAHHYQKLTDILFERHYHHMISKGKEEKSARSAAEKMAIEDARYVLPNSCETKLMMTMNVRSLYNFFNHRCCNRAQWEIRALADEMLRLCKETAPTMFRHAGPKCIGGCCPEGKMSCGKQAEMKKKYLEG